jgi:hypothetical protein
MAARRVRRFVVGLGLGVLIAVGASACGSDDSTSSPSSTTRSTIADPRVVPPKGGIASWLELAAVEAQPGDVIDATVVIANDSGEVVHVAACGVPFLVELESPSIPAEFIRLLCLEDFVVPVGESRWPTTITTTYHTCTRSPDSTLPSSTTIVRCPEPPGIPTFPPGDYRAVADMASSAIPTPAPVEVTLR